MTHSTLVIGLGGIGMKVVSRLKHLQEDTMPENLFLLAFDLRRSFRGTHRLGTGALTPGEYFLLGGDLTAFIRQTAAGQQLPNLRPQTARLLEQYPPEAYNLTISQPCSRLLARLALLEDFSHGPKGSTVWKACANVLAKMRQVGRGPVDIYLVSSTFGNTGSAWLVDLAAFFRQMAISGYPARIHALLAAPDGLEPAVKLSPENHLNNFSTFKELEYLQCRVNWPAGYLLYGGTGLGGLPPLLRAKPFDTLQVVDGHAFEGKDPDFGMIPAVVEGLLAQMDEQTTELMEALHHQTRVGFKPDQVFSSFGVNALVYPARLLERQSARQLVMAAVETLFPLQRDPSTGRPLRLAEEQSGPALRDAGVLARWLLSGRASGVLEEITRQAASVLSTNPATSENWANELMGRTPADWKRIISQLDAPPQLSEDVNTWQAVLQQTSLAHTQVFLETAARQIAQLGETGLHPLAVFERLDEIIPFYIKNLDQVEQTWKLEGAHSECEAVRKAMADARRDLDQRRNGSLLRKLGSSQEETQRRFDVARQLVEGYQQREMLLGACRSAARRILAAVRRLLIQYRALARLAALSNDSFYNQALDESEFLARELRFEGSIGSQSLVYDPSFESRQMRGVFDEFLAEVIRNASQYMQQAAAGLPVGEDDPRLPSCWASAAEASEQIDLADPALEPAQAAPGLYRRWVQQLEAGLRSTRPENAVTNFLNYLDPRAPHLAETLAENVSPLASMLTTPYAAASLLFMSENNTPYFQAFTQELSMRIPGLRGTPARDPYRMVLFRWVEGLGLDNLNAFHLSVPRREETERLKDHLIGLG